MHKAMGTKIANEICTQ